MNFREELFSIKEYPYKIKTIPWYRDQPIENVDQAYLRLLNIEQSIRKSMHRLLLIS